MLGEEEQEKHTAAINNRVTDRQLQNELSAGPDHLEYLPYESIPERPESYRNRIFRSTKTKISSGTKSGIKSLQSQENSRNFVAGSLALDGTAEGRGREGRAGQSQEKKEKRRDKMEGEKVRKVDSKRKKKKETQPFESAQALSIVILSSKQNNQRSVPPPESISL
ncbi:hypothetical protein R1flu_009569 [Riccia fluitans]|uniref:Uncharacterized protein n=1 Tax=Riccia fluitans TaxID=41844 RepID=A0ABD1Z2H6_9MARC